MEQAKYFQLFINGFYLLYLDVSGCKIMHVDGGVGLLPLSWVFWGNINIWVFHDTLVKVAISEILEVLHSGWWNSEVVIRELTMLILTEIYSKIRLNVIIWSSSRAPPCRISKSHSVSWSHSMPPLKLSIIFSHTIPLLVVIHVGNTAQLESDVL